MKSRKKSKRNIKQRKNKLRVFLIFLVIAFFIVGVTELAYILYNVKYIKVYDLFLKVENKVGINVDVEKASINLGIVPLGGSVQRDIVINNGNDSLKVNVAVTGSIAKFVNIEKEFYLKEKEIKRLPLVAYVPHDAIEGNYTGKIIIIVLRN